MFEAQRSWWQSDLTEATGWQVSWHHTKSRWSNVQAEWKEGLWWGKEIIINELHETIRRHSVLLVLYSAVIVDLISAVRGHQGAQVCFRSCKILQPAQAPPANTTITFHKLGPHPHFRFDSVLGGKGDTWT